MEKSRRSDGLVAGLALAAVLAIVFNANAEVPLTVMDFAASQVMTAHAAAPEAASPVTPVVQRLQPVPPEIIRACKTQPAPVAARAKTVKS